MAQKVSSQATRKSYEMVQMQLEVCISQERADIGLVCGKTTDMTGQIALSGFPLGSCDPIPLA